MGIDLLFFYCVFYGCEEPVVVDSKSICRRCGVVRELHNLWR